MRWILRAIITTAVLMQLAGPVLAANAKLLNLVCPSHVSEHVSTAHHSGGEHADHAHSPALHDPAAHQAADPVEKNSEAPRLFDLACCSAHLTGVMPSPDTPPLQFAVAIDQRFSAGHPANSPASIDPPPRIAV